VLLADTHCHLNLNQFNNDLEAVIIRARSAGVNHLLVPGIDLQSSRKAVEMAETWPEVYAAVGIHPNIGSHWNPESLRAIGEMATHPRVVAIGEIGLDNHWKDTNPELQREILSAQLEIAAVVNKPVILHSRDAMDSLWLILDQWSRQIGASHSGLNGRLGVLHSYEGSLDLADKAREVGFYISLAGPVTFPNAHEKHLLATEHPMGNLLLETDSPYLTPQPHRGQRNEPAYVELVAEKVASLRNLSVELVAEITSQNAANLFLWSK